MSRLGPWQPANADERLDRVESLAMIRQLAFRYALAIDSRDYDALVDLFVPDVRVGREQTGRDALKEWYQVALGGLAASAHIVADHIVSFLDADHARGVVYCRDELHYGGDEWQVGLLQYWDSYTRVDGEWCFERRRFKRYYIADALTRPAVGLGVDAAGGGRLPTGLLPDAFADLDDFWRAT